MGPVEGACSEGTSGRGSEVAGATWAADFKIADQLIFGQGRGSETV